MGKLDEIQKTHIKEKHKKKAQGMANESADKILSVYSDITKTMKSSLAELNESVFLDTLLAPVEASAKTTKNLIDGLKLAQDYDKAMLQIAQKEEELLKKLKEIETLTVAFLKDLSKQGDQRKIDIAQIYKMMDTNLEVAKYFTEMIYYKKNQDLLPALYYALGRNDTEGRAPDQTKAVKVISKYLLRESQQDSPDYKNQENLMPMVWTIMALMDPAEALEITQKVAEQLPLNKREKLAITGNFYGVFNVTDMGKICPEKFAQDSMSEDDIVKYTTIYKAQHEVVEMVEYINSSVPSGSVNAANEKLTLLNIGKLVIGVAAGTTFIGNAATRIFANKAWKDPAEFVKSFLSIKGMVSGGILAALYLHGKGEKPEDALKSAAAEDTDIKLKSKRDIVQTLRESPGFELFLEGNNHQGVEIFGEWVYSLRSDDKIAKAYLNMDNFLSYLKMKESQASGIEKQKYTQLLAQISQSDDKYTINGYPVTDDDILKMAGAFNVFEIHSQTAVKSYINGKAYAKA